VNIRVGHGYDVHRFDVDSESTGPHSIWLGGVEIPHRFSIIAHSDGDVLIHALCDAVLGAIGAGDIGQHFPDTSDEFKDIASSRLLEQVTAMATRAGWRIINVDMTLIAQEPKLAPFIGNIRAKLSALLSTDES
jgi:2-C-methyl-D-erythritol 2,4-cyclodiphosphate synthase